MRINPDGSVPRDNPFVGRVGALPEIRSYGHRNVQSAALHPQTGQLWVVEHGARGGDELNRVEAGKNYGWPVIGYGAQYWWATIGEGAAKPSLEQPVYYWDPVIAPSGMAFYTGDALPGWKGSLFIGSLKPGLLVRLTLEGGVVVADLSAREVGTLNKFIVYYLHPEARYAVVVLSTEKRMKISVGSNPWSKVPRTHNIAAICERYGGGGHPVVGAISLPASEVERAKTVAREIVSELQQ